MTVIYSDFGDPDTRVLQQIWEGLDAKILKYERNHIFSESEIREAISNEEDTLIIAGHGDGFGCWDPHGGYTLNYNLLPFIKAKNVIGIWCHASAFAERYNVGGFFSGMFISNVSEAHYTLPSVRNVSAQQITASEVKFCKILNDLLKNNIPLKEWKAKIDLQTDKTFAVENYNYSNTKYFG